MKTLNNYINEWKLTNNSNVEHYKYHPYSYYELREAIFQQLKENVKHPLLSVIDISNLDSLNDSISTWGDNQQIMIDRGVDLEKLEYVDLRGWDFSNIISTNSMFWGCKRLKYVDITGCDLSNIKDASAMFYKCTDLKEIKGIENWDISNIKDMNYMFDGCEHLDNKIINKFSEIYDFWSHKKIQ